MGRSTAALLLCVTFSTAWGEVPVVADVGDLAWMTGTWAGPVGDGVLEENWIVARDGSIGAFVRITGAGTTGMFEFIAIEQTGDTLVLHLQQWNPGMTPRTPAMQAMRLAALGDRQVRFVATAPGGLRALGYSRPTDTTFVVEVLTPDEQTIQIPLSAPAAP